MENEKQDWVDGLFLVFKVIFGGLLGGFIGMFVHAALTTPTDLSGDIINAIIAGFFTMIATIIVVIYFHFRKDKKQQNQNE